MIQESPDFPKNKKLYYGRLRFQYAMEQSIEILEEISSKIEFCLGAPIRRNLIIFQVFAHYFDVFSVFSRLCDILVTVILINIGL